MRNRFSVFYAGVFFSLAILETTVFAQPQWPLSNWPNPNQPDDIGVFMANGVFDATDPNYTLPTPEDFDAVIMGRDAAAVAVRRQEAVDYFLERFGIDFTNSDFAQDGNVVLIRSYNDPRWNYRCYKLPNRLVPPAGLIVHDAQYVMAVFGPQATLYGTWGGVDGIEVPFGTVAVNGEYLIQGTNRFRQGHPRNVHIRFHSVTPIFNANSGNIKFDCRLDSEDFGDGAALGRQETYQLQNGLTQIAINNVLQFPPPQWANEQD